MPVTALIPRGIVSGPNQGRQFPVNKVAPQRLETMHIPSCGGCYVQRND